MQSSKIAVYRPIHPSKDILTRKKIIEIHKQTRIIRLVVRRPE